ncbi:MAG: C39 family peptidase [Deltaproteobacteria bacterium]|nr:C39 family peptidase [Deltaproteobacteria bacterium]
MSATAPVPTSPSASLPVIDHGQVFCSTGFAFDAAFRLCVNATEAVGPFTTSMITSCQSAMGGTAACQGNRWSVTMARSVRTNAVCPPGASVDSTLRHCREGDQVFGPFSRAEVALCRTKGGGEVCETHRWHRSFVQSVTDRYCPEGFAYLPDVRLCASATEAVGPFTEAMIQRCVAAGGGEATCRGSRWQLGFARSLRGLEVCPVGASADAALGGVCREGESVFGPFTLGQVDQCRARSGGATCETARWHRSFVSTAVAPMTGMAATSPGVIDVPYWYQYNNANEPSGTCGVTSAAMVLNFWGQTVTPDQLYVRYGKSSAQSPTGLVNLYERHGLRGASTYNGTEAQIRAHLDAGRPVITHGYFTGAGHIMVIVGYDRDGWVVNDPAGRWRGCVRCGYAGTSTSTNGRQARYSFDDFRAAAGPDGSYWLSVASRDPVRL